MREGLAREISVRSRDLDDGELEREARVSALARVLDCDCEEVDEPQDGRLRELVRLLAKKLLRLLGHRQRVRDVPHVLDEKQVAEMLEEVVDEATEVLTLLGELLDEDERSGRVVVDHHVAEPEERVLVHGSQKLEDGLRVDRSVRRRRELVERRDGVAKRPARAPGDERERRIGHLDRLAVGDPPEDRDELREPRALEHERLAARAHGRDHVPVLGRAEDEEQVRRGLLDELEQGVPRGTGELVRLVEDVDLVAALDRLEHDALANLADVVDATLRGRVHLDDVE